MRNKLEDLLILNNNNNNLDGTGYPAFFLRGSGWLADLVAQDGGMECEFIPTCLVSQTRQICNPKLPTGKL